tara:strand:- start:3691 stop:4290 length:600 start_codon:yes stop_codon:yes gene_type:complete
LVTTDKIFFSIIIVFTILQSCNDSGSVLTNDSNLPKQKGFLRIDFEEPSYSLLNDKEIPFEFYYNSTSVIVNQISSKTLKLNYEKLGMSLDLSINKLYDNGEFLSYLSDFNLLLDSHTKKSNGFFLKEYENINYSTYGKIYEFRGNVASPIQFYITDSTSNFISGSINLKFKSNYDSIFPSIQYIKDDILFLFQSINWK